MLPQKHRLNLRQRPGFFQQAKRYYSPLFTIHYQHQFSPEKKTGVVVKTRAAVVVKKKDFKTAVERHRLARQARSALLPFLQQKPALDLVLVLKKKAQGLKTQTLNKKINKFYQWLAKS